MAGEDENKNSLAQEIDREAGRLGDAAIREGLGVMLRETYVDLVTQDLPDQLRDLAVRLQAPTRSHGGAVRECGS